MSLEVGSEEEGRAVVVSSRRVQRVTGEDAVGSSDAERFREDAEVVDSIDRDLYRFRPSTGDKGIGCASAEEFDKFCIVKRRESLDLNQARVSVIYYYSHDHLHTHPSSSS
jgi:hypothetical protein